MYFSRFFTISYLAFRNVLAHWNKNRIIVYIISVSFILIQLLMSSAAGIINQVKNYSLDALIGHIKISVPDYMVDKSLKNTFHVSNSFIETIKILPQVKHVTKRLQASVIVRSEREVRNGVLVGIDILNEQDMSFIGKSYPKFADQDIYSDFGAVFGEEILYDLKTQEGLKLVVSTQNMDDDIIDLSFFVSDTYTSVLPNTEDIFFFTDISQLQRRYNIGERVSEISIILYDDAHIEAVMDAIKPNLPLGLVAYSWFDMMPFLSGWIDMASGVFFLFFLIFFLAATFPLGNTLLMSVLDRMFEFGIMQALGFGRFNIFLFILIEAIVIMAMGLGIGIVFGTIITYFLTDTGINIGIFAQGAANLGIGEYIYPVLRVKDIISLTGLLIGVGLMVSIYPAFKAATYTPCEALSKKT